MSTALAVAAAGGPALPPTPLPSHPGNVFLVGEEVVVPLPSNLTERAVTWQLTDERDRVLATGACPAPAVPPAPAAGIALGRLGLGWYRVRLRSGTDTEAGWTSAAVLAPLPAATPADSPVCLDLATAWFARAYGTARQAHMEYYANLATLAGADWVRDRLTWAELETAPGQFAPESDYDRSAAAQAAAGLDVLQVLHATPAWAVDPARDGATAGKCFPRDLRHLYRFYREMARRFQGRVRAWEPWNEANIDVFGGHTTTEMSSLQKAAFLGLKAGSPQVTVCWNVFAGAGTAAQTRNVLANENWPYFDTYNIHTYDAPAAYLDLFAGARDAASGRPLWLSECGLYQPAQTPAPWGDLAPDRELAHARFIAKSYASSLFAGVQRHFLFILGNYMENGAQLGLMRHDHTPRPAYVAFAAVGRLLAGARCLGRVPRTGKTTAVYAFACGTGAAARDVLVAWSDDGQPWPGPMPQHIEAVADYLGRTTGTALPPALQAEPVFVVLPAGGTRALTLEQPPPLAPRREGTASPVVLQLDEPRSAVALAADAYERRPGATAPLEVVVYNFADHPVTGVLNTESLPADWRLVPASWPVTLEPQGRLALRGTLALPASGRALLSSNTVKLRGEFGADGRPVIAFAVVTRLAEVTPVETRAIAGAATAANWQDQVAPGSAMSHQAAADGGMQFEMRFGTGDTWGYPILSLAAAEIPVDGMEGFACSLQLLEGEGTLHVQFTQENGATYFTALPVNAALRTPQRAVGLFANAAWGPWSKPDPDGGLQPARIRKIMLGINAKPGTTVRFVVRDLTWVRY